MTDDAHHGFMYQQQIRQLFDNWTDRDSRELLVYTLRKHGRRALVYGEPSDYPNESIVRTMDGRRPFDFDGQKTLKDHLRSVIDSLISHDLEKAARHVPLVERSDIEEGTSLGGYDSSLIVASGHTEEEVIAEVDAERQNASLPFEERSYMELRRKGLCKTAKDFARHMAIPVNEVRNIERRLARRKRKRNAGNQTI